MNLTYGNILIDKATETDEHPITAKVIDEYKTYYVLEVSCIGGTYHESLAKFHWLKGESSWRLK